MEPFDILPIKRNHAFQFVIFEIAVKMSMIGDDVRKLMLQCVFQAKEPHVEWSGQVQQVGTKASQLFMNG
ncbi:hypothetical protein D1872_302870 [compost metagenome]